MLLAGRRYPPCCWFVPSLFAVLRVVVRAVVVVRLVYARGVSGRADCGGRELGVRLT
jgi:hypothetical protein